MGNYNYSLRVYCFCVQWKYTIILDEFKNLIPVKFGSNLSSCFREDKSTCEMHRRLVLSDAKSSHDHLMI